MAKKKPNKRKKQFSNLLLDLEKFTIYRRKGSLTIRKKTSLNRERIMTDVVYESFLAAGSRMGLISSAVKAIRAAISPFGQAFGDSNLHQRLMSHFVPIVQAQQDLLTP